MLSQGHKFFRVPRVGSTEIALKNFKCSGMCCERVSNKFHRHYNGAYMHLSVFKILKNYAKSSSNEIKGVALLKRGSGVRRAVSSANVPKWTIFP